MNTIFEYCRASVILENIGDILFFSSTVWAYAIPVALSGVRRSSSAVCRVLSVSTVTTRNNQIHIW